LRAARREIFATVLDSLEAIGNNPSHDQMCADVRDDAPEIDRRTNLPRRIATLD